MIRGVLKCFECGANTPISRRPEDASSSGGIVLPRRCSSCLAPPSALKWTSGYWQELVHVAIRLLSNISNEGMAACGGGMEGPDWSVGALDALPSTHTAVALGEAANVVALGGVFIGTIDTTRQPWTIHEASAFSGMLRDEGRGPQVVLRRRCSFASAVTGLCSSLVGVDSAKGLVLLHLLHTLSPRPPCTAKLNVAVWGEGGSGRSTLLSAYHQLLEAIGLGPNVGTAGGTLQAASTSSSRSLAPRSSELLPTKGRIAATVVSGLLPTAGAASPHFLFVDDLDRTAAHLIPSIDSLVSPFPVLQVPQSGCTTVSPQLASLQHLVVVASCSLSTPNLSNSSWPPFELPIVVARRLARNHNAQISRSLVANSGNISRSFSASSSVARQTSQSQSSFGGHHRSPSSLSTGGWTDQSTAEVASLDDIGHHVKEVCRWQAGIHSSFPDGAVPPTADLAMWLPHLHGEERLDVFSALVAARAAFDLEPPTFHHVNDVIEIVRAQAEATLATTSACSGTGVGSECAEGRRRKGGSQKDACRTFLQRLRSAQSGERGYCAVSEARALYMSATAGQVSPLPFEEALQKLSTDGLVLLVQGGIKALG